MQPFVFSWVGCNAAATWVWLSWLHVAVLYVQWSWLHSSLCVWWSWLHSALCVWWSWLHSSLCVWWSWLHSAHCVWWSWLHSALCVWWSWLHSALCVWWSWLHAAALYVWLSPLCLAESGCRLQRWLLACFATQCVTVITVNIILTLFISLVSLNFTSEWTLKQY